MESNPTVGSALSWCHLLHGTNLPIELTSLWGHALRGSKPLRGSAPHGLRHLLVTTLGDTTCPCPHPHRPDPAPWGEGTKLGRPPAVGLWTEVIGGGEGVLMWSWLLELLSGEQGRGRGGRKKGL